MESLVVYKGHRIAVEHHLDSLKLIVDGMKRDEVYGVKNTNKDNVLETEIINSDNSKDEVRVVYIDAKLVKLTGKLLFYYNGELIAEKRTL